MCREFSSPFAHIYGGYYFPSSVEEVRTHTSLYSFCMYYMHILYVLGHVSLRQYGSTS